MKKNIKGVIGLTSLLCFGSAHAQTFSISELLQISASLPKIGDLASGSNLNASSGLVTLNDGTKVQIQTKDGRSLAQAVNNNSATFLYDGKEFSVSTSADSLKSAYTNDSTSATFNLSAVIDSRLVDFFWEGPFSAIDTESVFKARINGQPVTFVLPNGTTLADFNSSTPFRLLDQQGNVLLEGRLDQVSPEDFKELASLLGVLNADKTIAAAQRHAIIYNFDIIANQINRVMRPNGWQQSSSNANLNNTQFSTYQNANIWVSSEFGDASGNSGSLHYDANTKASMFGIDTRMNNILAGITIGRSSFDLTSDFGQSSLSGNFVAPYGAVALLDNNLVFDGILLYQDLDGNFNFGTPTNWSGDRIGARVAGTYYLPKVADNNLLAGITAGGVYLKDMLNDAQNNNYRVSLGEAFVGGRLVGDFGKGDLWSSITYYKEVSSSFDQDAALLEADRDYRTELQIGTTQQLTTNVTFNLAAKTTLGAGNVDYKAVQAGLAYSF